MTAPAKAAPRRASARTKTTATKKTAMPAASRARGETAGTLSATPEAAAPSQLSAPRLLPLADLIAHPDNPSGRDVDVDEDLAASIAAVGLLAPLVVAPHDRVAGKYTLLAGHRRRRALQHLERTEALCVVREDLQGPDQVLAMLGENGRRKGLTALEEAAQYAVLRDKHGLSQRAIAERAGCNQSHVSRALSLLRLPEKARAAVALEQVAIADAAQLAQYSDHAVAFDEAWQRLTQWRWSPAQAVQHGAMVVERQALRARLADEGKLASKDPYATGSGLTASWQVPLEETKHAELTCHRIWVSDQGVQTWCCVRKAGAHDDATGKKKSAATVGLSVHEQQRKADERERTKALKARTAAVVIAGALLDQGAGHTERLKLALTWMRSNGVVLPANDYAAEAQLRADGDKSLLRLACAMALAGDELHARRAYGRWDERAARWVHRLVNAPYRSAQHPAYAPNEWERARLREQVGIVDVDAFLAAPDPTTHLPAQPTLHDELGTEPANDWTVDENGDDVESRFTEDVPLVGGVL